MSDWAEQAALDAMQRAEPEMGHTAFHRRLYRRIVRALREARAMGPEWQDISTAKKDGSDILLAVYRPEFVDPIIMNACWIDGEERGGHWSDWHGLPLPTHWQPLPAPPKES